MIIKPKKLHGKLSTTKNIKGVKFINKLGNKTHFLCFNKLNAVAIATLETLKHVYYCSYDTTEVTTQTITWKANHDVFD